MKKIQYILWSILVMLMIGFTTEAQNNPEPARLTINAKGLFDHKQSTIILRWLPPAGT
jgi:hypothetical protein